MNIFQKKINFKVLFKCGENAGCGADLKGISLSNYHYIIILIVIINYIIQMGESELDLFALKGTAVKPF